MIGAVEAGGTKIVCATGTGPADLNEIRFPTGLPETAVLQIIDFFRGEEESRGEKIAAIGIGTFGPADVDRDSATWGYITNTPKENWKNTDLAGPLKEEFGVPVAFETDVNAAAVGEGKWGAAVGLHSYVYFTIGTGIGGGAVSNGRLIHGQGHPEMGHLRLPRDPALDPFQGTCPFHGDCFEGLASGPAIGERWGRDADQLPPDHEAWPLQARYLALAALDTTVMLAPQQIIFGGGVMEQEQLFPMVRGILAELLNDYVAAPEIVPPGLGNKAGILGALALGLEN